MKKLMLIFSIIVIIGFIMFQLGNKTTVANKELDIETIANVLQDEDILLNEWTFHAREHLVLLKSDEEIQMLVKELQAKYPDWEWTESSDQQKRKVTAVSTTSKHHQETLQIITTLTKQQVDAYMIYEVKGGKWNQKSKTFLANHLETRLSDIFRGNPTIFSCMKGVFNDKMNAALPHSLNKVLSSFHAKEIEALKEETFMSISASSPLFDESIKANQDNMNMQIAVRNQGLGEETTIVVGTPIITIEY
jgi:hypothetical protein